MTTVMLVAASAYGYSCAIDSNEVCSTPSPADCFVWPTHSMTYRINTNDFSSAEADEIEAAAEAWNAGSGEVLRGADWEYVRGADLTVDGTIGDGVNNVRMKSDTWFDDHGLSGLGAYAAVLVDDTACEDIEEVDITFNSVLTYGTALPSQTTGPVSIGQLAGHEWGHGLGLGHQYDVQAIMDSARPHGGDIAATKYRIHEVDFVGLRALYTDSSTGTNLMLSRYWWWTAGSPDNSDEAWSDDGTPSWAAVDRFTVWEGCPGETLAVGGPLDGPSPVYGVITQESGAGTVTAKVEWRLDPGSVCFVGTEYVLGTRSPGMVVNTPFQISPSGGYSIPSNTPLGDYHLCAMIDSDFDVAETSESDNIVRSEKVFEVVACSP